MTNKVKNKIMALVIILAMLLQCLPLTALAALEDETAPVGQWSFDEGEGTTAADTGGNDNHGTIAGPTWIDGMVGKALSFSGNGCVEIPHHASLNPRNALTIEAWINPSTVMNWRKVISKSVGSNTDYSIFQGVENNLAFSIKMGSIARTAYAPANSVPLGEWTYVVGTYDGCRMKLYLNGTLVKTINISGEINAHAEVLKIGGEKQGAYFEGKIDEVKIYNEALTAAEILERYDAAVNPVEVGTCIGQWSFDEGEGSIAVDNTDNGNNGLIGGAAWVDGKRGSALSFDGNDYVEIPYNPALNPRNALTIEAWVNPASNTTWQRVVSKSYHPNTDYSIFSGDKNNIAFSVKMGSVARTAYSPANSVPVGVWTYVVGTYDGAKVKLYINGVLVKCITISGTINAHEEPLRIGGDPKGDFFRGMIDEISIYNRALTAEEISSRYEENTLDPDIDSDGDTLTNGAELLLGTDPFNKDTDNDGLEDNIDVYLYCDPTKADTDEDGISDLYEDSDEDGLSNFEEIELGTNPVMKDTDEDGLIDGREIGDFGTNPLTQDTDEDKASDKWELDNGYDPCVYNDSFVSLAEIESDENIKKVSLRINDCDGSAAESLTISTIENALFNKEIPGYIGECCELTTDGNFESADLAYTLDEKLFEEEDFMPTLYYYDENTQLLEEVENQTINGNVLSATLTHFSKYIVLDKS